MTRLIIASGNRHKISEIGSMLRRARFPAVRAIEVVGAADAGYGPPPDIEESADSFVGNAILKADGIADWLTAEGATSTDLVLADDSGLCVEAFDNAPGVYSARFAGPEATDEDNNAKLVAELEARHLDASPAEYVCVLAVRLVGWRSFDFTLPDTGAIFLRDNCLCVEGRCRGKVRTARQGQGGFGYDPYFWIDNERRTFADLSQGEKAQRSHRGVALRNLVQELPLVLG